MNQTSTKAPYSSKEVEDKWTEYWFSRQLFNLDVDPARPSYSCALPPPNITGNLHMGHALNGTLQDVLIRWKRMQGFNVLWQPGMDHAGIATQMVVERQLKKEGKTRHQIGRDEFLKLCWQWRHQYGDAIMAQYKRLGVSFNWDRPAFTMDPGYVRAIYRAFAILFREGHIYRGHRVCNWCPRCLTSVSDLEVEHKEITGKLYHVKYPLAKEDGGSLSPDGTALVVATTRPESMFGDVAVAVNPKDSRHAHLIGKHVNLPLTDRLLPVVADEYVDMSFGTGALKVTPAHDAADWEIGQRHKLPAPVILDPHGRMLAGEYVPRQFQGKDRFVAREEVVQELEAGGWLEKTADYDLGVGYCERCQTVIEPYLSDQWYLRMQDLAEPAIKAVEDRQVVFIPDRYAATYLDWMRNIRDWNISRQLWWGHRIPIWTCTGCAHVDAFEEPPARCSHCGGHELTQDEDVLDTWFSSALWPFATLGWPEATGELKTFYPTTFLSTAREIINLWVARMIFTSLKFVGTIPFKYVLIHPVIQTADGKRMSKSKGNAVDPLVMIDKYGADANRFWFASLGIKGDQDVKFREDRLDEYKRFANKLWNAGRLVQEKLQGYKPTPINRGRLSLAARWILSLYNRLLLDLEAHLNNYDFHEAADALYTFTWDHFCDWYLEIAKSELAQEGPDGQTRAVLHYVFEGLMRALAPLMPFITEELWSKLPHASYLEDIESIMFAPYPRGNEGFIDESAEQDMGFLIKVIRAIRNIRQTFDVPPRAEAEVVVSASVDQPRLAAGAGYIKHLAGVEPLRFEQAGAPAPRQAAFETIGTTTVYVPLGKLIDIARTRTKLLARQEAAQRRIAETKAVLAKPGFRERAPADKVSAQEAVLAEHEQQSQAIAAQLALLDSPG